MELLVPTVSDIVFKYSWPIKSYKKTVSKKTFIDSPSFDLNVNGIRSTWSLSIRFWKGPEGKRITNPVVLCLNMLSCSVEEVEQAKIRFQFAVFNANINHWEFCQVSRTVLELKTTKDIISLGYRDLSIVDRHYKKNGEVSVMVKIQIIQCEVEKNSLAQDMARLLKHPKSVDTKLTCGGSSAHTEIPVHASVIAARSDVLADMIVPVIEIDPPNSDQGDSEKSMPYRFTLDLTDLSPELTEELLRYIYTDHVDNLDFLASQLLAIAERFRLKGLKELCERNLIETLTPENVASLLLMADEFNSDCLKRAGLAYCEENAMNINKSFAWKIMEQVNPELFHEACEAGIGGSQSSNMDDSELSN
ncbi:speckle-type POZ protein isoform X2 [Fopius arisanus]|uniref:Speckle-type POZ protein isoform X2 n=2 Tax=Fopius arisanus TaxID=64838 RepID=A0A9R1T453_9HYME|nr:PREDICTED: speckle-type POZ protein-like isoform X2 [Fopius arisanus]